MKIVKREEFLKLPSGTLYSEYEPWIFEGLKIKKETIFDGNIPIDFIFEDLIGNVAANSSTDCYLILDKSEKDSIEFELDFACDDRDGLFSSDALYAVYNKSEITQISNKISGCI